MLGDRVRKATMLADRSFGARQYLFRPYRTGFSLGAFSQSRRQGGQTAVSYVRICYNRFVAGCIKCYNRFVAGCVKRVED